MSIASLYKGWEFQNAQLTDAIRRLSPEQLALPIGPPDWPIWATASHIAGTRVFWLCHIFKEPGAETTPFVDPSGLGWEDDLTHPRGADELVDVLGSTWKIVERCLATWTPEGLSEEFPRVREGETRMHTRQSVLFRAITHDAYHSSEISLALGSHGLGAIDLWSGLSRVVRNAK